MAELVSDELWEQVAPLLPPSTSKVKPLTFCRSVNFLQYLKARK